MDYNTNGRLYWRFQYFDDFFKVYSIDFDEFRWIISEWVDVVLGNVHINSSLYDMAERQWVIDNLCNKEYYWEKNII